MLNIPKPNTQALSWFYSEYKNRTLKLDPKYQRNPIWSIGQKCFLIDSLISGCPIPQVFLNIITTGLGGSRKTYYEVVDGQQRLRAILEFMQDEYKLIATTAKSYPVSDEYKPYIGKKYSELPPHLQDLIWNYQLAVQELRDWSDDQIRALFRRLNYVVERLNKQEMRHSQYFGEFVTSVERLSDEEFWDRISLFSRRDSQRMKDIEFISELLVLVIDGPQDQQKSLDKFYAEYDVDFPRHKAHMIRFRNILKSLDTIATFLTKTRFTKKADFYGIFGAVNQLMGTSPIDLRSSERALKALDKEMNKSQNSMSDNARRYHLTVIEGPNKLPKRSERIHILKDIMAQNM